MYFQAQITESVAAAVNFAENVTQFENRVCRSTTLETRYSHCGPEIGIKPLESSRKSRKKA
jgi:hypothetical protein